MIELLRGDITGLDVNVIVNAANSSLMGGGGVDGAIHRAGGPDILEDCKKWKQTNGNLKTGEAMMTTAGKLPAGAVIHTVGPVWQGGTENEDQLLANCYIHSLHIAFENHFQSIAFPNISTGVYGFPKEDAAEVAISTVANYLGSQEMDMRVIFICFDEENYEIYQRLLK